ncbi:MAG: cytochrome b/b6 domain-containing protein [Gammaproteobacteria bacterium]|nr:cytochrome b/b6 domain-containing protein [Gammaproteobacteria bacterium]
MTMERIYIFKRFERFWHWTQALLIMTMMMTGFEIHGTYNVLGFQSAVNLHTTAAWALITLWVFAIFWHFTTGEWKQYIPTMEKVEAMMRYYVTGIFTHAPHPFRQTMLTKHNPLQRLAYLFVKLIINPLIWLTGLLYLFYSSWNDWGLGWLSLGWVATFHVIGAFMMLVFFIAHIYLATAGHTPTAHIKAMITGWEEVD